MRGCLFTLLLGAIVLGFAVVVGLPAAASAVLTGAITAAGLQADDTTVGVASDPPTDLLGLHADRVRIRATDATFHDLEIGELDVTLGDVAIIDRTVETVEGTLAGVTVPDVGGRPLALAEVTLVGGGETITASTTVDGAAAEALLADAIEAESGVRPSSGTLSAPDRVAARMGVVVHARLRVNAAGDLVAKVLDGPEAGRSLTLLRGGDDLPIHLTGARVTTAGDLRLTGDLEIGLLGFLGG
ncbi:MAG: hypothetical protein MUQ32_02265 [Chloroflexi bacterium]|nr:hypothetical protein [Chloroflexota bacterium]